MTLVVHLFSFPTNLVFTFFSTRERHARPRLDLYSWPFGTNRLYAVMKTICLVVPKEFSDFEVKELHSQWKRSLSKVSTRGFSVKLDVQYESP